MKAVIVSILGFIILAIGTSFLHCRLTHTCIKAEFKDIDPLPPKMDVFYKGYRLGTTKKLKVSKDFKTTFLYITLNQNGLHLPNNITAEIKQNNDDDIKYVDLIYPAAPSLKFIRSGDVIDGRTAVKLKGFSESNQRHFDSLTVKGESFLGSAKDTMDSLTVMFNMVTGILEENRSNIYNTTTSLSQSADNLKRTSENLESLTRKMDREITNETIKNSTRSIELMMGNFAKSSDNFYVMSGTLDKSTAEVKALVKNTNTLVDIAKMALCNLNDIIVGFKTTLRKKFGGARVLFKQEIP